MTKPKLTVNDLLVLDPCSDSRSFIAKHKTLRQIWAKCERADWMCWALTKLDLWDDKTARLFACACARHTVHLFEEKHPDDKRPRQAIEAAEQFATNPTDKARNKMADRAAAGAARAAAGDAAWAAARAAGDAARDAAWAAARAAGAAAWAAAGAAENKWQADTLRTMINPFKKGAKP